MVVAGASLAAQCVAPHLRCLRLCGYCHTSSGSRVQQQAHNGYRLVVLAICALYMLQECIYAYQERGNMDKLSRVMFLLLCHLTSIAKQAVFYMEATQIDALLNDFDDPLLNQSSAQAKALLAVTSRRSRQLQRCYSGCAIFTCVLWLVFPIVSFLRQQPVEFAFWLPIETRHPVAFAIVLLYSFYVTTLVGIANTTMDAFIGTVLYQCTTQITILRMNIEKIFEKTLELSKSTGEVLDLVLMREFRFCLQHYNKIIKISSLLQEVFGTAILIQFTVGGWILCMAAYKMVSLNVLSVEFASMALFIICILTELFLYCFFGNELTYESALLLDSLYACGWERGLCGAKGAREFKRALLVAGERARRPLRAAAARLVPLSLETFLKILKSSYTFYAVLRQTK